jgi:hypothetical protein
MRRPVILVALLALAACGRKEAGPPEVAITEEPPDDDGGHYVRTGRLAHGEPDAPAVSFRLRDGGLLQMKIGEEWRDATLNGASDLLATAR